MGSSAIDREDLAERLKSRAMPSVRLDRSPSQEVPLKEKRTDIDWDGVQRERNSGTKIRELAAKYRVHVSMIYSHTRPAGEKGTARRGRPRKLAAPVNGDELPAILDRLKAKRDKLNAVISALEDL